MYIYAETAFHHEGDLDYLKELVSTAKSCGANGVKFQVLTETDYLISKKHSQYQKLKSITLPFDEWREVFDHTEKLGLDIVMMPIDPECLRLLEDFNIRFLDLHSVSFNDLEVLTAIKSTQLPLILGVGGRRITEIQDKIGFFKSQLNVLMTGFQSFPSRLADVTLEKIRCLSEAFPLTDVGYADHSSWDSPDAVRSNSWAFILGARFFEKHLTLNEGKERIDYNSAVGPEKFKEIINELKYLNDEILNKPSEALNDLNAAELKYRSRERVIVAKRAIRKGEKLRPEHLVYKMTDAEGGIVQLEPLLGKITTKGIEEDEIVNLDCTN
ncbi:N-acetylneuraminate synthase family protein [Roseivirga pacifica]|uniref:N-acetylneuraminate synthase family protein n=1 Tax=Roseivirga pacifica TaxID=1267423 RepID=UPI00227C4470|nr:N-acetylneuraminate synthase family protein [Roseivirga pacifica]